MKSSELVLFGNVVISKGAKNMCVYDLQHSKVFTMSARYFEFFNTLRSGVQGSGNVVDDEEQSEIELFVIENHLGHRTNCPNSFPEISATFQPSALIDNLIIDIQERVSDRLMTAIDVPVNHIQLRVLAENGKLDLLPILQFCESHCQFGLELYVPSSLFNEEIRSFVLSSRWLYSCLIYNSSEDVRLVSSDSGKEVRRICISNLDSKMCGQVQGFFSVNIPTYTESLHHNSCLNRKISIDAEGNIKNCPSMKESYGNIKDTTLAEAIEKPGFKKYWNINKDKIHVCKDCEFRYICTDCRAYVEDPEDILSKPLKCGYNPYTGEWSEWSTNPLKQKAIDFYGMREMVEGVNKDEK